MTGSTPLATIMFRRRRNDEAIPSAIRGRLSDRHRAGAVAGLAAGGDCFATLLMNMMVAAVVAGG